MKTCSVTSTGAAGISMTSRVRCTHPPVRVVWHSGQDSGAWTTRRVGSIRGRAKPWGRFLRGFFSCSAGFLRLAAGVWPGILASAGQPGFQALYPLPHLGNGVLLFRDDSPLFRDNRQQGFPARLLQVQFRSHCSFMPQLRSNRQCFHQDSGLRQIHLINSELLHNCGIA